MSQVFECLDQGDNVAFVSLQEARDFEKVIYGGYVLKLRLMLTFCFSF